MGTSVPSGHDQDSLKIACAALDARRIVAAIQNRDGNLQVVVWQLSPDGSVKRYDSIEGGPTSNVAICVLAESRFLTAARTEAKKLKITIWDVDEIGGNPRLIRGKSNETTGEIDENFAIAAVHSEIPIMVPPIPPPFCNYLVVTAVRTSDGTLKLITWKINLAGTVERLKDQPGENVHGISTAVYESYPMNNGSLATAVTVLKVGNIMLPYTRLKVISWKIDSDGSIKRQGEAFGDNEAASSVTATSLCHNRIVTTNKDSHGNLVLQKWRFDPSGSVTLYDTVRSKEKATEFSATAHNATRIYTALINSEGNLRIILWDAADKIVRLDTAAAGRIKKVSIVPLGSDWICTPVIDAEGEAQGGLKVIAWREHSVPFLRAEWGKAGRGQGPRVIRTYNPATNVPVPVEPTFAGGSGLWDPMIAVGFKFVIASQDHGIVFLDKQCKPLDSKYGENCKMTTDEFFSVFKKSKLPDGKPNENCILRHMGYTPADRMLFPPYHVCDPDSSGPPSIDEFYDTRVHFDPESKRFFILAACRNAKKVKGTGVNEAGNPLNRRYIAFAVSKTEDPRDGFYQWLSTEAYVSDAPEFTVNDGIMAISKKVDSSSHVDITRQPFGYRHQVCILSVEDLIQGKSYPRSHKFFADDFANSNLGELGPVTHYGYTGGRTYFLSLNSHNKFEIFHYSVKKPSDWNTVEFTKHSSVLLPYEADSIWQREHPKFRNNKFYLTWMKKQNAVTENGKNARYNFSIVRLPLNQNGSLSTYQSDGFLHYVIPGPLEPPLSYSVEQPTISVTKNGDMFILYCVIGYQTPPNSSPHPQARYTVIRANESSPSSGNLIREGEFTPFVVEDGKVKETYFTPELRLDYQTAATDPYDDETVWMITEYAKAVNISEQDGYRTIICTAKLP